MGSHDTSIKHECDSEQAVEVLILLTTLGVKDRLNSVPRSRRSVVEQPWMRASNHARLRHS